MLKKYRDSIYKIVQEKSFISELTQVLSLFIILRVEKGDLKISTL
jgi:hypothetical protein